MPDLPILQHLSPSSSLYRQIIETFTSDKTRSPTLEGLRLQGFSYEPSIPSPSYHSPEVKWICPEPSSPSVEEEVEQYEPESVPYQPEYCALDIFDDETEDICSVGSNLDQKRKKTTPQSAVVRCKKSRMTGEWQLNENELGQEFYVNQRTGQVAAKVPIIAEECLMRERRKFMPFGTSPIMQLAPSCELKMDANVQQKLNQAVEENLVHSGDASAASKWQSLEEFVNERDKLGIFLTPLYFCN